MRAALSFLLIGLVVLLLASPAAARDLSELAARAKRSVVRLDVKDSQGRDVSTGSGFFVSSSGRIVTNQHVIDEAGAVEALLHDGRRVPVKGVVAFDAERDVAIIQAEGDGYEPLQLGTSQGAQAGDQVAVIGSPVGLAGTLSVGIISAVRADGPKLEPEPGARFHTNAWSLQITAPISPGSSGSPVLDTKQGTVIGVAVGQRADGQALNFAVPVEHVRWLLDHAGSDAQPKPFAGAATPPGITRNLLYSLVFFGGLGLAWWLLSRGRRPRRKRA